MVSSDIGAHKLTIIDLNGDGSLDFVAGLELTELRIYLSNSAATPTFTSKTINTTGCHNTRVGDVTGDGRVDLLCNNYLGNPPVQLYINQAVGTFLHAGGPCAVAGKVPFSFMFRQIRHQTIIKQQARFLCPRHARGLL